MSKFKVGDKVVISKSNGSMLGDMMLDAKGVIVKIKDNNSSHSVRIYETATGEEFTQGHDLLGTLPKNNGWVFLGDYLTRLVDVDDKIAVEEDRFKVGDKVVVINSDGSSVGNMMLDAKGVIVKDNNSSYQVRIYETPTGEEFTLGHDFGGTLPKNNGWMFKGKHLTRLVDVDDKIEVEEDKSKNRVLAFLDKNESSINDFMDNNNEEVAEAMKGVLSALFLTEHKRLGNKVSVAKKTKTKAVAPTKAANKVVVAPKKVIEEEDEELDFLMNLEI